MNYNYEEVINKIQNTRRFGNYTGYEVSKSIMTTLGNPQCGIPFVHIAGTNGKGSTTAFLANILQQSGKRIGMFTSPHLITFRERIRINGEYISKQDVTRIGNMLLNMEFPLPPTMFDYCLAMAVIYFKEQKCDMVVIETGIGGRYDSTNALGTPELAIITKIGLDHTAVLGDTLEEIAHEKAGIIKDGCPVVMHMQEEAVKNVILTNAKGCTVYETSSRDMHVVSQISMKMKGRYQIENAATAALAARIILSKWQSQSNKNALTMDMTQEETENLTQDNLSWIECCIRTGLSNTLWKGRMEIINEHPFFMIDGAHNAHGVHALATSLKDLYPGEKFHFIMGVMADKDYEDMIEELLPLAVDFVTVTPESDRSLQSKDLAECIVSKGVDATYVEDMEIVICPLLPQKNTKNRHTYTRYSQGETHSFLTYTEHKTIAFGSLYFIGAIETMLKGNDTPA